MALRIGYFFNETIQGLRRNGLVAFAAVSTAFIALFLVGGALMVSREVNLLIDFSTGNVEVSVFLQKNISPDQQAHIGQLLGQMPEVDSLHYESQQEAYQNFLRLFHDQPALIQNISADALPSSFRVKLKDPEQYPVVAARLVGQPGIDLIR